MNRLEISHRKKNGVHYTPSNLADFVAYNLALEIKSNNIKILDPSIGDGELLISLIKYLKIFTKASLTITGFEIDNIALKEAKHRIENLFPDLKLILNHYDFIDFVSNNYSINNELALFTNSENNYYDLIIANPPYVRTQVLGATKSQQLSKLFNLTGRIDLYFVFVNCIASILKPGGFAGIIVSNKFMITKAGISLRLKITELFDILHIWDFGDTKLFEAAVLPCVILLKKKDGKNNNVTKFTSIYTTDKTSDKYSDDIFNVINENATVKINSKTYRIQQGKLDINNEVWILSNNNTNKWLKQIDSKKYLNFGDIGKIRVGVKTTADRIFIRDDWNLLNESERPELLKPLITHKEARQFRELSVNKPKLILYPHHVVKGRRTAINIYDFPNTLKYLLKYKKELESRTYLIEAGRNWYELWVPQDPNIWTKPKIVFWDIAKEPTFWLNFDGAIVNGDCYWFTVDNENNIDLLWLILGISNTKFIEDYYDTKFNNKLYAGRRRFISQYVEKFPIPDPDSKYSQNIIKISKEIFYSEPFSLSVDKKDELNELTLKSFGL